MSFERPTIWMNVTTSAQWQRPPVGIVRVEQSLFAELSQIYGEQMRQCVWQDQGFVAWTPPTPTAAPPQSKKASTPNDTKPEQTGQHPELPPIFPILPRRQALKSLGQALLSLAPTRWRPTLNRWLYKIRPQLAKGFSSPQFIQLVTRLKRKNKLQSGALGQSALGSNGSKCVSSPFKKGDILISVGLDWDHPYYKEFYALRQQQQIKIITCCYDLIPVLYPQYCVNDVAGLFTSYFLDVADGSDLVLCISKQSEKDLNDMLERTGGARPPTWVFPLGDTLPTAKGNGSNNVMNPEVTALCQQDFILYVSSIERRKNHEVLYRAYHLLCAAGKKDTLPKLVFVGMPGWGVGELLTDLKLDPLIQDKIVFLNHVTDAELMHCYQSAMFCVFPSLYEGWGLPVGEALAMGKVVLSSDRGSLPEVGGDLVKYIDPWSPHAWAQAIEDMVTNTSARNEWQATVQKKYVIKTWQTAAQSVHQAIQSL